MCLLYRGWTNVCSTGCLYKDLEEWEDGPFALRTIKFAHVYVKWISING